MAERRAKYGNRRVAGDDGITVYDSVLERNVARVLDLLVRQQRVRYERQVSFVLAPRRRGLRSIRYVADFLVQMERPPRPSVVVEVKGYHTPAGRLKLRWFAERYPETPVHVVHAPQEVLGVIEALEQGAGP